MSTIPATQIVTVTPSVLAAAGEEIVLNGLFLTNAMISGAAPRVPVNTLNGSGSPTVQSFPTTTAVDNYFGSATIEAGEAGYYFAGFTNSNKLPGAMLMASECSQALSAYLKSASLASMSLTQLQALSGSLNVTIDGAVRAAASINLSTATSFTAAASLIQTGLNASPPSEAVVTGSIAAGTASFSGFINGNVLTVSGTVTGTIQPGSALTGAGVSANTVIQNQLSGTTGGDGTYAVNIAQTVPANTAFTANYGTLNVTAVTSGTLSVGQGLTGTGITAGTVITALGTGSGGTGTYIVNLSQTATSTSITANPVNVSVVYDSVTSSFVIISGITGLASTAAYATGTLAASLLLTQATGAVLSQGTPALTPSSLMNAIIQVNQNWAAFKTVGDPDLGAVGGPTKLLFTGWTSQQNKRYAFIATDYDASPAQSSSAPSSYGQLVKAGAYDGTCVIWTLPPSQLPPGQLTWGIGAFILGTIASIDFTETNGRTDIAFRAQAGITPQVTDAGTSTNLLANGYNFYGVWANANQQWQFFWNGTVSGSFDWLDSYVNQIWLNASFISDMMTLLTQVGSVPYNFQGDALIEAALADTIQEAGNFGAYRPGVTLSALQVQEVNNNAGINIATTLQQRGYYLQVKAENTAPSVRQVRGSPPATFWYVDGEDVQSINLASVLLQ